MPTTVLDLLTAVARASCRYSVRCGTAIATTNCDAIVADEAQKNYGQWFAQGQFGVNAARADACLRALESGSCDAASNTNARGASTQVLVEACDPFFGRETISSSGRTFSFRYPSLLQGRVAIGGACRSSVECVDEGYCDLSSTCPGRCAAAAGPGPVPARVPCRADLQLVEANDTTTGPFRRCVARPTVGGTCTIPNCSGSCTLACPGNTTCKNATCQRLAAIGESCVSHFDCAVTAQCLQGRCAALSSAGAPCGFPAGGAESLGLCKSGLRCSSPTAAGTCVPDRQSGDPCSDANFEYCPRGLACGDQGRCVVPTVVVRGAACNLTDRLCDSANVCIQTSTSSGVCSEPRGAGQSCIYSFSFGSCRAGLVCESSTCAGCPFVP